MANSSSLHVTSAAALVLAASVSACVAGGESVSTGESAAAIVGGTLRDPAATNAAVLQRGLGFRCSATLLSPQWALTAGQCFFNQAELDHLEDFRVVHGASSAVVSEVILPRDPWVDVAGNRQNDTALVRLASPLAPAQRRLELTHRRVGDFVTDPRPLVRCFGYGESVAGLHDWGILRSMDNVVWSAGLSPTLTQAPLLFYPNPSGQRWGQGDTGGGCVTFDSPPALMGIISDVDDQIGMAMDSLRHYVHQAVDTHLVMSFGEDRCLSVTATSAVVVGNAGVPALHCSPIRMVSMPGTTGVELRGWSGACIGANAAGTALVAGACNATPATRWDVTTAAVAYGGAFPRGFGLRNHASGKCVAMDAVGTTPTLAACSGTAAQTLVERVTRIANEEVASFSQAIRMNRPGTNGPWRCLGVPNDPFGGPRRLRATSCSGDPTDSVRFLSTAGGTEERVALAEGSLDGTSGPCLAPDVAQAPPGGAYANGTRIVLQTCSTTALTQRVRRWRSSDANVVRFGTKCLSIPPGAAVGTEATLQDCGNASYQQAYFPD